MKNSLLCLVVSIFLISCGSGPAQPGRENSSPEVSITGNIYNRVVVGTSATLRESEALADPNIPYSILNAACDGLTASYLPDISQGETITVEWTIENLLAESLQDIQYIVEMENTEALHRETWICFKRYDTLAGDGNRGVSIWEQSGGYFYNTVAAPVLPACESPMAPVDDICDPSTHDCANPWWAISYDPPSSGCTESSGFINLSPYEVISGGNGYANSNIDIRPGHLARFQALQDGKILDEKCYSFDVTP